MQLLSRLKTTLQPTETGSEIEPADAYSVLDNERRRLIIEFLATHEDDVVKIRDMADHLSDVTNAERQTCYISVHQSHCCQMERAGIVTWDEQAQTLRVHKELHRVYEAHQAVESALN